MSLEQVVDLSRARSMDRDRVLDQEGRWYLRSTVEDEWAIYLVSKRAPVGTGASDLVPDYVEVSHENEDGITIDYEQLKRFMVWP